MVVSKAQSTVGSVATCVVGTVSLCGLQPRTIAGTHKHIANLNETNLGCLLRPAVNRVDEQSGVQLKP